jgi:hypothetical protein
MSMPNLSSKKFAPSAAGPLAVEDRVRTLTSFVPTPHPTYDGNSLQDAFLQGI